MILGCCLIYLLIYGSSSSLFINLATFLVAFSWCAGHAQQLGGESPLSSLKVVKD